MEATVSYDYVFKIVFMGKKASGKTSTAIRIVRDEFPEYVKMSSLGYDRRIKVVNFDEKTIKLEIFDIDGADKYMTVRKTFHARCDALVYFYDITDRSSWEDAKEWLQMMKNWREDPPPLFVIGNKTDLIKKRAVDRIEGVEIAQYFEGDFFEISAKTGDGLRKMIMGLVQQLMKLQVAKKEGVKLLPEKKPDEPKSTCS